MEKRWGFFLVISVFCVFYSCVSLGSLDYPQPEFDKPFVFVIDTSKAVGSFEDYVKLQNASTDSNMNFFVYVHHPKNHEWLMYGVGKLKGPGDTDTINSGMKNMDLYRYFAIESTNGKEYKYQFYKSRNDLYITILDN
jgi:hypothetical protein